MYTTLLVQLCDLVDTLVLILTTIMRKIILSEIEFKEFEQRLKFKPRLKYGWFHFLLHSIF